MKKKQTTKKKQTWTPAKRAAFAAKMKAAREAAAATKKPKTTTRKNPPIDPHAWAKEPAARQQYAKGVRDGTNDARPKNPRARYRKTLAAGREGNYFDGYYDGKTTKNPPTSAPTIALPENVRLPNGFIWGDHWTDGRREGYAIRRLDRTTYLPDGAYIVAELRSDMSYAHGHVEPGDLEDDEMTPEMVRGEILEAFERMDKAKRTTKNPPAANNSGPTRSSAFGFAWSNSPEQTPSGLRIARPPRPEVTVRGHAALTRAFENADRINRGNDWTCRIWHNGRLIADGVGACHELIHWTLAARA